MDQPLKQRLIGVTIAVALVVIFVPMLFDKSDDKGRLSTAGIPPIPDDVLEKPLELPKTAEDIAEQEKKEAEKNAPVESGYRIVPLHDEPPPKPKAPSPAAENVPKGEEGEEPVGAAGGGEEDEGEPGAATPAKKTGQAARTDETARPVSSPAPKSTPPPVRQMVEPKQPPPPKQAATPASKPQPAAGPRMLEAQEKPVAVPAKAEPAPAKSKPAVNPTAVRPAEAMAKKTDAAKKPETAKSPEPPRPAIKTVKVNKPKPAAPPREADDEGEPIPAPAPVKAETPPAKPKPAAALSTRPATAALKKPQPVKPAAPRSSLVNAEKPESSPPAPAQPAKPAADAAKAKKPTAWVIQAGSFADEAAAKGVAEKLKQSKFPASVKAVQGEHGSVYRVQVGAEPDRKRAEETLKQIQGSTGINGFITPRH